MSWYKSNENINFFSAEFNQSIKQASKQAREKVSKNADRIHPTAAEKLISELKNIPPIVFLGSNDN